MLLNKLVFTTHFHNLKSNFLEKRTLIDFSQQRWIFFFNKKGRFWGGGPQKIAGLHSIYSPLSTYDYE
jgi:hypothetical protein